MTPVIHCSMGTISLIPQITFSSRKDIHLARCHVSEKYIKLKSCQRFHLPKSSLRLFQLYDNHCTSGIRVRAAIDTDVSVEEPNPSISVEVTEENSETESSPAESSKPPTPNPIESSIKGKRTRPVPRSEMPSVKDEELVIGASFTGKVRSIQPFGCFVDFGSFTDGLVHVSRLSDGYVKDVGSFVTIGQEVKVRVLEVNRETGRISLTMRETEDNKVPPKREPLKRESGETPRPVKRTPRTNQKREDAQKNTKLVKGQILDGTVKNVTRSGAFVSLPDGEEGFLPVAEESEGFGGILGNSSLEVGQEVNVRVLRIARGKVTLTMKKEEDLEGLNMQLNKGVEHKATNAFELAFRKNKHIATFLNEREEARKSSEKLEQAVVIVDETSADSDSPKVSNIEAESRIADEASLVDHVKDNISSVDTTNEKLIFEGSETITDSSDIVADETPTLDEVKDTVVADDKKISSDSSKGLDNSSSGASADEIPATNDIKDTITAEDEEKSNLEVSESLDSSSAFTTLEEVPKSNDVKSTVADDNTADKQTINIDSSISGDDKSSENGLTASITVNDATSYEDKVIGVEKNEEESAGAMTPEAEANVSDEVNETQDSGNGSSNLDSETVDDSAVGASTSGTDSPADQTLASENFIPSESDGQKIEEESPIAVTNVTTSAKPSEGNGKIGLSEGASTKATISPSLVKQLREETGAGMMDCKKALAETGGDIVKAQEFLRKKGLASADKKASRATAEGRIGSYIHDNRIGILVEVNCETDFVARGDIFKELVDDLAMQVAACPQVRYLVTEDVGEDIVKKEREIEMQKEDILNKPENIREKIVDGRIRKRLEELALLEQPYIKNDKLAVKDWVKQTISTVGENIKVKRFIRYNLGEGLEKKSQDFAAEVAAQTAAKSSPAVPKDQATDTKETAEKVPTVTVSAALVKQLREETGAGMMDCKKALAETGGDLEKAQEYLRKKGLSSADKKSSRLAAEGLISAYIHDSRIGALIEVNCETDFVARNEKFRELVSDLAMQVVACPQVESVSIEEIPESTINKEKEIEMQRDDLKSKPDQIKEKIVEGRITKRLGELALLEQPFIKDDSIKVKDLVKQTIAALGENIKVRRFVRFTLGESKD